MKKTIVLITLLGLTAPALAQDETFTALDTDANGAISLDELKVAVPGLTAEEYAAADTDGDGSLSEAEFLAYASSTTI